MNDRALCLVGDHVLFTQNGLGLEIPRVREYALHHFCTPHESLLLGYVSPVAEHERDPVHLFHCGERMALTHPHAWLTLEQAMNVPVETPYQTFMRLREGFLQTHIHNRLL